MIIEQTIDRLTQMKLFGMSESVKKRISRPDHRDLSLSDMLGLIVDDEWIYRDNKRRQLREGAAKFKDKQATIESIEYGPARGFTKSQVLELAQLTWVTKKQNLAVTGPTGSGKSWLAQSLGQQACREGLKVLFLRQPAHSPDLGCEGDTRAASAFKTSLESNRADHRRSRREPYDRRSSQRSFGSPRRSLQLRIDDHHVATAGG